MSSSGTVTREVYNRLCRDDSVDVLSQPSKALAVALSFQHTTHEELQRPRWKVTARHGTLITHRRIFP